MEEKDARKLSLELMEIAEVAHLSTIDPEGYPETRAMWNLRRRDLFPRLSELFIEHQDDFLIYFSTNTSSSKIAHIKRNPKISVYYCKPKEFRGLMLGGEVEIVTEKAIKESLWHQNWEIYYPEGPQDPDYTVLRLFPLFAKYYHQMEFSNFVLR